MARYSLNLPKQLKQQAEVWAKQQDVSLNQFILWAVSEKVGGLNTQIDDERFPLIAYRTGAAGRPTPVIRGTGIRVQTLVIMNQSCGDSVEEIADAYDLTLRQVEDALSFYQAHRQGIDANIALEEELEAVHEAVNA